MNSYILQHVLNVLFFNSTKLDAIQVKHRDATSDIIAVAVIELGVFSKQNQIYIVQIERL